MSPPLIGDDAARPNPIDEIPKAACGISFVLEPEPSGVRVLELVAKRARVEHSNIFAGQAEMFNHELERLVDLFEIEL